MPPADEPFQFTEERFILCEGDDDKFFLEALISQRNLPRFQVRHAAECNKRKAGGRGGFIHALDGFGPISGFDRVRGVLLVTDNDFPIPKAFRELQKIFKALKYPQLTTPTDVATIVGKPGALLFIPDPQTQGDLETLCWPAVLAKWPSAQTCVPAFLKCTGADQWNKVSSINKATVRSAIVGHYEEDPYNTLGLLFKRGILSTAHSCFDAVAKFLTDFDQMVGI
jgi:hypothetical protein